MAATLKKYFTEYMHLNKGNVLQIRIDTGGKRDVKVITLTKPCSIDVTLITGTIEDVNEIVKL